MSFLDEKVIIQKGLPQHIAIILDGNGRWAKKRLLPRTMGHRSGANNLEKIAKKCNEMGIKCLTVYAFSTENWNRPTDEVDFLMDYPVKYFEKHLDRLTNSTMKIKFLGRKDRIPKTTLETFNKVVEKTKDHTGMTLNICFDYGARNEIVNAFKEIYREINDKKITLDDVNEETIEKHLFTAQDPKLDLLIRTSGECRISNFLLWQLSYAELYFTDCYWPDFDEKELFKAISSFQGRKRRFGGLNKEDDKK